MAAKNGLSKLIVDTITKAEHLGKSVDLQYICSKIPNFTKHQVKSMLAQLVVNNLISSIRTGDGNSTIYSTNLTLLTKRVLPRNTKVCVVIHHSGKRVTHPTIAAALDSINIPRGTYCRVKSKSTSDTIKFSNGYWLEVREYNQ